MRVAIFIRCHKPDAPWLEYCLRSIEKYATCFEYVMLVVPTRDHDVFFKMQSRHRFKIHAYIVNTWRPMLSGEVHLCHADEICNDVDAVCCFDSDCLFVAPATPEDYLVGGKPVLIAQSYEYLASKNNPGVVWQGMAENALGWKPTHETMRHPTIYHRGLFAPFRAAVEQHTHKPFDKYVMSCREQFPQTFAELTSLGAYAAKFFPDKYYFADVQTEAIKAMADSGAPITAHKLAQYWSHDSVDKHRAELEAICSI